MQKNDESNYYKSSVEVKKVCTATIPNDSQWMVNLSLEGLTVPLILVSI